MESTKTIALFGTYQDNQLYSHTRALKTNLIDLGYTLVELRPGQIQSINKVKAFSGYFSTAQALYKLLRQWLSLCRHISILRSQKLILVPYPAHADILLLRLLTIGKRPKIIMDAFLGLHDTIVCDRKLFSKGSVLAKFVYYWERYSLSKATKILIDTEIQCNRLSTKYNIAQDKVNSIPVGLDEAIWVETAYPSIMDEFRVVFWGTFIPLHGISAIIEAAHILQTKSPTVKIQLIGTGQTAKVIKDNYQHNWPQNIHWIDAIIPMEDIIEYAQNAHCILGIFGDSEKAASVIPYKINQALALNRPVITRKTDAFEGDIDISEYQIFTVDPLSATQLANQIHTLVLNPEIVQQKVFSPRKYYEQYLSNHVMKEKLKSLLSKIAS